MGKRKSKPNPAFAERLDQAIDKTGRRAKDIADELGVSESLLSKWRNGVHVPEGATLLRLPTILDCDGHWLTTGQLRDKEAERKLDLIERILRGEITEEDVTEALPPPGTIPETGTSNTGDPDTRGRTGTD